MICDYASLDVDIVEFEDGVETITFEASNNTNYVYTVFAYLFYGEPLIYSGSVVDFYWNDGQSLSFEMPTDGTTSDEYWVMGCFDHATGDFKKLNYLTSIPPTSASFCIDLLDK